MLAPDAHIGIKFLRTLFLVAIASGALFGYYKYTELEIAYQGEREYSAQLGMQMNAFLAKLKEEMTLSKELTAMNGDLQILLQARTNENQQLGGQVQELTSTVGTLDKLVKTDKQLLAKYSSVYFLNENYAPAHLTDIHPSYLLRPEKPEQFITEIVHHLTALMDSARSANIPINILSGYRSFGTQANLKQGYKVAYGSGTANAFSADQGYSEHQLGATVDFTNPTVGTTLTGFERSKAFAWLTANAHKYGFILSYPKGNEHFVFEPWHWRYVGVELATKLYSEKKSFYDLDQREIDEYLIKFFD